MSSGHPTSVPLPGCRNSYDCPISCDPSASSRSTPRRSGSALTVFVAMLLAITSSSICQISIPLPSIPCCVMSPDRAQPRSSTSTSDPAKALTSLKKKNLLLSDRNLENRILTYRGHPDGGDNHGLGGPVELIGRGPAEPYFFP